MGTAKRVAANGTNNRILTDGTGAVSFGWSASANQPRLFAGSALTATGSDGAFHAFIGIVSSGAGTLVVDGTATTGPVGSAVPDSAVNAMGGAAGSVNALDGSWCEAGIWPAAFNSTQYGNMNTNMHGATNGWNF
jgi:hypothetical protein